MCVDDPARPMARALTCLALVLAFLLLVTGDPLQAQAYRVEVLPSERFEPPTDSITVAPLATQSRSYTPVIWGALVGLAAGVGIGGLYYSFCKDISEMAGNDCLGRWFIGTGALIAMGALAGLVLSGDPPKEAE